MTRIETELLGVPGTFESLPIEPEEVMNMDKAELVRMILSLAHKDTTIRGVAGMQCNTFLSNAALALAAHEHLRPFVPK